MNEIASQPGPLAEFRQRLADGRFCLQHCASCGKAVFYPRAVCPHCHGTRLAWRETSGLGTVHACTVIHRLADKGGPYNVVLIDLDEGARMMSRIDGVPPDRIAIGDRVRARIVQEDGEPLVVFVMENADLAGAEQP